MLKDWLRNVLGPEVAAQGTARFAWNIIETIFDEIKGEAVKSGVNKAGEFVIEKYQEKKQQEHKRSKLLFVMLLADSDTRDQIINCQVALAQRGEHYEDRFTTALINYIEQIENDFRENSTGLTGAGGIEKIRKFQAAALNELVTQMDDLESVGLILNTSATSPFIAQVSEQLQNIGASLQEAANGIDTSTDRINQATTDLIQRRRR